LTREEARYEDMARMRKTSALGRFPIIRELVLRHRAGLRTSRS
jgi:hypothetical protein